MRRPAEKWSAKLPAIVGLVTVALLVGGLGVWSVSTKVSGAVIAPGVVQVENKRRVIQHPEGGVVGDIRARDGDDVKAGDVLIRFDDTYLRSELAIVERQSFEISMRVARLEAERDGRPDIAINHVQAFASLDDVWKEKRIQGQVNLFHARRLSFAKAQKQMRQQVQQIEKQIIGARAELISFERQGKLIVQERKNAQALFDQGLLPISRLLDVQREEAVVEGEIGRLTSRIAEARERIAEIEIEELRLSDDRREDAMTQLSDLRFSEIELREKQLSLRERLSRLEVKAPVDGIVLGSIVLTTHSVVKAAETMMFIVPDDRPLHISVRIDPMDIEHVFPGQDVVLRFSTLEMRTTPEIPGKLAHRSADILTDDVTGAHFYEAIIYPDTDAMATLSDITLLPGMPVDAFLRTRDRTPFEYLSQPLAHYFTKVFR